MSILVMLDTINELTSSLNICPISSRIYCIFNTIFYENHRWNKHNLKDIWLKTTMVYRSRVKKLQRLLFFWRFDLKPPTERSCWVGRISINVQSLFKKRDVGEASQFSRQIFWCSSSQATKQRLMWLLGHRPNLLCKTGPQLLLKLKKSNLWWGRF